MKDPTAKLAARNLETADRSAALVFRGATSERVWIDRQTARAIAGMLAVRRDQAGELHGRLNEKTAALLHQDDGRTPVEGINS